MPAAPPGVRRASSPGSYGTIYSAYPGAFRGTGVVRAPRSGEWFAVTNGNYDVVCLAHRDYPAHGLVREILVLTNALNYPKLPKKQ